MNPAIDLTHPRLADKTVTLIGMGGLGCPAALALVRAGLGRLVLVDDDQVDESNLHRQLLYVDADIGNSKLLAAERTLQRENAATAVELVEARCLPHNARELMQKSDLVLEGADNYATKFLVADAALLEQKPVIHGAAVGFRGTVLGVSKQGSPCYRCLFEDLPSGPHAEQNCDSVGVIGPVVGFVGALMADLALQLLTGHGSSGQLYSYNGLDDRLRTLEIRPRADCCLCGERRTIVDIDEARYVGATCAA